MTMTILYRRKTNLYVLLLLHFFCYSCSQKTCPNCGSLEVPYPLSTNPNCGNPDYSIRCDPHSHKLYLDTLNGSSYVILRIMASFQRMVVQPSPWMPGTCVTQDMSVSEGLWLNQTLPFNVTSSNTIFLFNCSPRLLVSPLNCTPSSLCHKYLLSSGHVDAKRELQCASDVDPCCTFIAGGMPSAYKIRLHISGCQAFRSILHLDAMKPANEWEEGLEIQWSPPPEPHCKSQSDCSGASTCSPSVALKRSGRVSARARLAKAREDILKSNNGGKPARMFCLKEMKKATNGFSKDRILGHGGFGEVYRGELHDGTIVAVKLAKVGNVKSTQQVLNEVGILSQVNHRNLVKLLGCCIEAEQPLMIYEYISNGTLHDHLHGKYSTFLDWKTRLKIASQTAEALAYLHSAAYPPIYHRDVKSTNILLDNEFNAKVSDFGISRLACPGLSHVSTCAQGTLGYLDPEYFRNYQLTDKSDVYSFGVVLLEFLTSQKAVDFSRDENSVNLVSYVIQQENHGSVMDVVDRRLLGEEPLTNVTTGMDSFLALALSCLRETKTERPCMKDVVQQLHCISEIVDQEEPIEVS
ncbi:wall-associated receptor kinase-like 20 [Solanum verrucosum]|uniref:wall-associated receptor kinase-like 20 n=1 Tax=Solanum verrucosum TaxID=315347 RepID=UPI0020D16460|nr:wall-associated receptor kinase-like 20 [Solanum verrucosum]